MTSPNPEQSPMMTAALAFLDRGFHVIPLGDPFSPMNRKLVSACGGDENLATQKFCKKSRVPWEKYQKTAPTEAEITEWWTRWPHANIGVVTGININVVDTDNQDAFEFIASSGGITRTPWKVKTPRGTHFYYAVSQSLTLRNSAANGLDVRGHGGYVVAPPSQSINDAGELVQYEWQVDMAANCHDVNDLPILTHEDVSKIYGWRGPSQTTNETGDILGHLGSVKDSHDGSPVAPGGRNNALASLIGQWVNKRYCLEDILAHARVWNASNTPPLSDAEIIKTVTSICMGHQKRHDTAIPLNADEDEDLLSPPKGGKPIGAVEVMSLAELEANPPEKPETFWIPGVLFRGARVMIAGAPKVGKSRFALALATSAACGIPFMGHPFEKPLKVLWLQAEIHMAFVKERTDQHIAHLTPDDRALALKNLFVSGRMDRDITEPKDFALINKIMTSIKPDVLILDPVINFSTAEENDNTQVRALMRRVDKLSDEHNCAVILVHHTKKLTGAKTDDPFETVRGASAFRGWFDSGILLSGGSENTQITYQLRNTTPIPSSVCSWVDGTYQSISDLPDQQDSDHQGDMPGMDTHRDGTGPDSRTNGHAPNQTKTETETEKAERKTRTWQILNLIKASPQGIGSGELRNYAIKTFGIQRTAAFVLLDAVARFPGIQEFGYN